MTRITIKDAVILSHLSKQPDRLSANVLISRLSCVAKTLVNSVYKG